MIFLGEGWRWQAIQGRAFIQFGVERVTLHYIAGASSLRYSQVSIAYEIGYIRYHSRQQVVGRVGDEWPSFLDQLRVCLDIGIDLLDDGSRPVGAHLGVALERAGVE